MLQLYVTFTYMFKPKVHLKMTLNGITMGLIAEVLLHVTAVAIAGTVQSQVRGDNSHTYLYSSIFRFLFTMFN